MDEKKVREAIKEFEIEKQTYEDLMSGKISMEQEGGE